MLPRIWSRGRAFSSELLSSPIIHGPTDMKWLPQELSVLYFHADGIHVVYTSMCLYLLCAVDLGGPMFKSFSNALRKFLSAIIGNVRLLCPTRHFRGYFGHLGTSIVVSLVPYSYLLSGIASICMLMVHVSLSLICIYLLRIAEF